MITWLVVILAPMIILALLGVLIQGFRPFYPSFEVKSCFLQKGQYVQNSELEKTFRLHLYLTVEVYLLFNFFLDGLLMAFIYLLRKVQQEFSMTMELMTITVTQLAIGFLVFFIIIIDPETSLNKTNNVQYIIIARGVLFLIVSAILPIRATYNPNSIIPFPINEECIKTLEMALLMPTSANYFYEYLETLCGSERNRDALVYFGLYADIRQYLREIEEGGEEQMVRAHAQQLIDDYIGDKRQWEVEIPGDVYAEMRAIVNPVSGQIEAEMVCDENTFSGLYYFVLDVLEGYYREFQRSRKYDQLKDEVQKQEILYEYLRRYSMISN
ncbi:hypothetical protein FGO68_gene14214 [Halteria grandinella]|uniref:RGS domain-containing protein n=1 Tax=Halteria grandinella TaxID=5974 RepID=A0A8J8P5V9_HALGN|nr:hypothetical protein FGO68_gene14214 [Halteria grandinella]